jgi:hypothetical protein
MDMACCLNHHIDLRQGGCAKGTRWLRLMAHTMNAGPDLNT